jgi:putative transposase
MSGNPFHYSRHLPHIQPFGATLFVTFRLHGSMPLSVQRRLQQEQKALEQALDLIEDEREREQERYRLVKLYFGRWDRELDQRQAGPNWLQDSSIANLVSEGLHYRDSRVYTLHAFCIMPNYVHLLCTPLANGETYHLLFEIMQSLKGHTARQANKLLARTGTFWQEESYDHYVRNSEEHQRIVHYIRHNPVKAGLVNRSEEWPWTFVT